MNRINIYAYLPALNNKITRKRTHVSKTMFADEIVVPIIILYIVFYNTHILLYDMRCIYVKYSSLFSLLNVRTTRRPRSLVFIGLFEIF